MAKGIAASGGKALAPVLCYVPPAMANGEERATPGETAASVMAQVRAAVTQVDAQLARAAEAASGEGREILEMHRTMAGDSMLLAGIEAAVSQGCSAPAAVARATQSLVDMLTALDDPLFTLRVPDTRDVGLRLSCALTGETYPDLSALEGPVVLVGADLPPSLLAGPGSGRLAGVVMGGGNRSCHAAILCGALEIPAVMGVEGWETLLGGALAFVDGDTGTACAVSEAERSSYEARVEGWQVEQELLRPYLDRPTVTAEGESIGLYCNIFSAETAKRAHALGADGGGLFRTEFLYMNRPDLPGEEEQLAVYRAALEAMPGKSVTFRTMDIGGDKEVAALGLPKEDNAFLGYRAIRVCLDRPDLFRTQLRALLRASRYGKARIMFPMISGSGELTQAKGAVEAAKAELTAQGVPFDAEIPVGIMVEIPSAAVLAPALAQECDFFSIGSNDLTQYTLAVDRMNPKVAYLSDPMHPAVLWLIQRTIRAAAEAGIPCSVCGELAGMEEAVPVLLGMGLKKFSVSPNRVLAVRRAIAGAG